MRGWLPTRLDHSGDEGVKVIKWLVEVSYLVDYCSERLGFLSCAAARAARVPWPPDVESEEWPPQGKAIVSLKGFERGTFWLVYVTLRYRGE